MAWTKDQQAAIESRGQTLLLSAAAGSGKTAVLVERIIQRLLDEAHPLDISELLVVTFTKAAAAEMRERIASALSEKLAAGHNPGLEKQLALLPSAHISTLHAFCQSVIRRYFYTIDIDPKFMVAADEELSLLRRNVLEELFLSYYEDEEKSKVLYMLADMFSNDRGDDDLMQVIVSMYNYSRSMPWPEAWLDEAVKSYDIPTGTAIDDLPWSPMLMQRVKNSVAEQVAAYKKACEILEKYPELATGADTFKLELHQMEAVLRTITWQDMSATTNSITFTKLTGIRNLDDDVKAVWKDLQGIRNNVKKAVSGLQKEYFSSTPDEWLTDMRTMKPIMLGLVQLTKDFAAAYRLAKKDKGWVDFNDLEYFCLQILLAPESEPGRPVRSAAAEELCQSFKEVLIDEYQDTNGVQELITWLVSHRDNRFMVGDIKQSIYRFRLADPTLFLSKYNDFSRDEDARERCIDLGKNFRSAANILEAVNEVFARAMTKAATDMEYGNHEKLYVGRSDCTDEHWIGGPIEVHLLDGAGPADNQTPPDDTTESTDDGNAEEQELTAFEQECVMIAQRLMELMEQGFLVQKKDGTMEPLAWHHIVILMRSLKNKADAMLQALQAAGIPAFAEQSGGYFGAIEVEVMMALLRCIDNPQQDLPMAAVLRSPLVGIGETTLAALRLSGEGTLWELLPAYMAVLPEGEEKQKLVSFSDVFAKWRTFSRRNNVADLLQQIYDDTSYLQYVGGMVGGAVRQANLQALYTRARQYEDIGYRGLFRYLQFIDKVRSGGTDLSPATVLGENEDVVRVMSIHKSKGLEFPVVVISDMGKDFNKRDTQSPILYHQEDGIGLKYYDADWRIFYPTFIWQGIRAKLDWEGVAEEERILYVAMTRAKDKLILTGHNRDLSKQWTCWQRNLAPGQAKCYLDWVMPVIARAAASKPLTELIEQRQDGCSDVGLWQVHLHHSVAIVSTDDTVCRGDPRLDLLESGELTETAAPVWLENRLLWQYAYPQAVHTPAKFSVSEIKRQFGLMQMAELASEHELAATAIGAAGEDSFAAPAPWLTDETEPVTGAKRGTAVHKVMQYVNILPDMTEEILQSQLVDWETEGLFTAEETAMVQLPPILSFCQSDLGRRMAAASTLRREYPFSVLFSGGGYLPSVEPGEQVLVQGVIDAMFREPNGWVIVDYKTDHLATEEEFRKRYAVQLALYKQAMEQITGEPVSAVCIYSFHLQKEITF